MQELEGEFYFGERNLIQIEVGSFKYKTLMDGWLNHLYLSANSSFNSKTMIISKKQIIIKINFEISKEISPINSEEASEHFKRNKFNGSCGERELLAHTTRKWIGLCACDK